MATVVESNGTEYLCTFSVPESGWIHDLAKCMGITKEAVLGAAINHGLTHYVSSFLADDEPPEKAIDEDACDDLC